MNFSDTIKSRVDTVCNTRASLFAFAEYIDSAVNRTTDFMSKDSIDEEYLSIPVTGLVGNDTKTVVALLSKAQYESIFDPDMDGQSLNLRYTDSGDCISVPVDTLEETMENYVSELKTQKEFVKYCLASAEVKATEFYQKVSALTSGVPGSILEKYGSLIETAGSPVEALKNFISMHTQIEYVATNQYVEIIDPQDYSGNVWLAVWNKIVEDVSYFFVDVVWEGILKLSEYLQSIWNGLLDLIKWGVGQLFSQFLTDYEKASNAIQGIMDFPLFQINLGEADISCDGVDSDHIYPKLLICDVYLGDNAVAYSGDGYNKCLRWNNLNNINPSNTYWLSRSILNLVVEEFEDKLYKRIMDVVVPCDNNPYDLCLRIGWGEDNHIYLSGYAVCNFSDWSKNDDLTNNQILTDINPSGLIASALQSISKIVPLLDTEPFYADISYNWSLLAGNFILSKYQEGDVFPELFKMLNYDFSYRHTPFGYTSKLIYGMLLYMCIMSVGFQTWRRISPESPLELHDYTDDVLPKIFNSSNSTYTPSAGSAYVYKAILDPSGWDNSLIKKSSLFTPYLTRDVLPTTVHYQTINDRAKEIITAIRTVLVVAVVIYVGVKLLKFTKNFRRNSFLAEQNCMRLSWDVGADPSNASKQKAFFKAYKKMKHMQLIGNILGLTTTAATNARSSVDASSFFVNTSKSNSDYVNDGTTRIIRKITGVN